MIFVMMKSFLHAILRHPIVAGTRSGNVVTKPILLALVFSLLCSPASATTTYTSNKGFPLQGVGDNPNTWGTTLNSGLISVVDQNLAGRFNISVAGSSDYNLSAANAENVYHNLSGLLTGNISYVFPSNAGGFYFINNGTTGNYTVTAKPNGGTGIAIPQGYTELVFLNPDTGAITQPNNALASLAVSGAVTVGSTLDVTGIATMHGATSLLSTLQVAGDVSINTNKFNVTAASGNTAIAGGLTVAGTATLSSALSVTGTATFSGATSLGAATGVTATAGDNTTNLATTAFVTTAVSSTVGTGVSAYQTAPQTTTSGAALTMTLGAEDYDDDTMHDNSTNPSRVTIKTTGRYEIDGTIGYNSNANGNFLVIYLVNGSEVNRSSYAFYSGSVQRVIPGPSFTTALSANDYVEMQAYQNTGSSVATVAANTRLQVKRIK